MITALSQLSITVYPRPLPLSTALSIINFESAAKKISWTGTNFTFLNEQASSSTAIRTSDSSHYRVYSGSQTTFTALNGKKIVKVVVTCESSSYANVCKNSAAAVSGATVTVSGSVVTITFATPVDSFTFKATAQWRLHAIEVTLQ